MLNAEFPGREVRSLSRDVASSGTNMIRSSTSEIKRMHPLRRGLGAIYDTCYHNAARAIARIAHFLDLEEEAFEEIFPGSYLAIWAMRPVFARAKLGIVRAGCPAGQSNPGGNPCSTNRLCQARGERFPTSLRAPLKKRGARWWRSTPGGASRRAESTSGPESW